MKFFLTTLIGILLYSSHAHALESTDYIEPAVPSTVFITAVQVSHVLDYVEIYNVRASPVDMSQWSVLFSNNLGEECEVSLQGWLLAKDYGTVSNAGVINAADDNTLRYDAVNCGMSTDAGSYISEVQLLKDGLPQDVLAMRLEDKNLPWARRGLTTTYRTGNFGGSTTLPCSSLSGKDFASPICVERPQLYTGGWYMPPMLHDEIKVVEILANPRNCSPLEDTMDCVDFVKLYVAGLPRSVIDQYRLRSDSGVSGQAANLKSYSTTNNGMYLAVPISLTNSGGWVWLEDTYGAVRYSVSAQNYPDASSESKKGLSWAHNEASSTWNWMPSAPDAANYWPPTASELVSDISAGLADCGPGRERNPETNRCRNTISAARSLTPCKPGQERNPDTNRCRSVLGASTTLKPCEPGEVRSPETNRCRKVSTTVSSLVPCKPDQERNPETNRCRKVASTAELNQVQDVESGEQASTTSWWITGGIVVLALGYVIYEWRQEIFFRLRR